MYNHNTFIKLYARAEKVSKLLFICIISFILLFIFANIVISAIDRICSAQIEAEEEKIRDIIQESFERSNDKENIKVTIKNLYISPKNWFAPFSERIPSSDCNIKLSLECSDNCTALDKIEFIKEARKIIGNHLVSKDSMYSEKNTDCIEICCGTKDDLQSYPNSNNCLCISFYNHTVDLYNSGIPKNSFDSHSVLFTLNQMSMNELECFTDDTSILVSSLYDLETDHDFSNFKNLKYLAILDLDDPELEEQIRATLPEGCKLYSHGKYS